MDKNISEKIKSLDDFPEDLRRRMKDGREATLRRMAEVAEKNGDKKLKAAGDIPGSVISDEIIQTGGYWSGVLEKNEHLRIVDLEGRQAVDFIFYDYDDLNIKYNAANTMKLNKSVYLGKGFKLYSDTAESLLTIVEDTVGNHDTIGGCCSTEINFVRYGVKDEQSCRRNFTAALSTYGLCERDIPANINFFMNVPIMPNGEMAIVDGLSEPGDFVDLQADKKTLVVLSNCPQRFNDANGWNPTPIRLLRWMA
ncbi:DUF1989 domain-containing protein [Castellaniella sp.]|uniref:DUF1989 domain-containing protein n=1 Tax=Castellaniella sp. TaxID=1955812 RepID=UPI003569CFB7